jgi:adenosylmethionine-8-amino-7-oxononanoate aminotransferase
MNAPHCSHHLLPFVAKRAFATAPRLLVGANEMHCLVAHGRRFLDGASGLSWVPADHGRAETVILAPLIVERETKFRNRVDNVGSVVTAL